MLRSSVCWLLCLILAFQGGLRLLGDSQQLAAIQALIDDDVELICTGSSMKWVSVSLSQSAQHFVFVEPPEQFDDEDIQMLCPGGMFADQHYDLSLASVLVNQQFSAYKALVASLYQRPYTSFTYQTALSRAPPKYS